MLLQLRLWLACKIPLLLLRPLKISLAQPRLELMLALMMLIVCLKHTPKLRSLLSLLLILILMMMMVFVLVLVRGGRSRGGCRSRSRSS